MSIPQALIRKKRDGLSLSSDEIAEFMTAYVNGQVKEYQMSAMAMAIFFQGLSVQETSAWLQAMIQSGRKCDWSKFRPSRVFVDKHSTGGVGDKTSLIVLPLLIADGFDVPMIAGRGLGHTGGTLDKLESIPGFKTEFTFGSFCAAMEKYHGVFAAQSPEFVPADRKLYALRDVTATVESLPLITASIMSKKLSEDLDALILDVKCGSGAFLKTFEDATKLAEQLVKVGQSSHCHVAAVITNMDEPLGRAAGNALEVEECFQVLKGAGPTDTRTLSLELAAAAACLARKESGHKSRLEAFHRMKNHLDSGIAWELFCKIATAQGAEPHALSNLDWVYKGVKAVPVYPLEDGYIHSVDCHELGLILVEYGAGRKSIDEKIHPGVGLTDIRKKGERVSSSEPLCVAYLRDGSSSDEAIERIRKAFLVRSDSIPEDSKPLILSWIYGERHESI